jgi:hypothetical protein
MLLGPNGTGNLIAATRCDPNLSNNCRTISRSACGSLEKLSRIPCSSMVVTESCLPTVGRSRWDQGLTAAEMKRCHWVKPSLVCQVKFTEWTRDDRLRQPVFLGIREDKNADSREGKLHWLLCVELVSLIASPRSYAFVVPFRVIAVCGFCIIHSQVKKAICCWKRS